MSTPTLRFFAPCPRGLEPLLARELATLGAERAAAAQGGVAFYGAERLLYRANLESRLASRVLLHLLERPYRTEDDVYRAARSIAWPALFDRARTIRVALSAVASPLKSLDFATLRVKDAVCDAFRDSTGARPDVDTRNPDVRIHVFLERDRASFYLDTSGEPLFKRGWRTGNVEAPLRENLAAGILQLAGWTPGTPLLDPMCGGGTFLLEAATAALGIAPGARRGFGFERLARYDARLWREVRDAAEARRVGGAGASIPHASSDGASIPASSDRASIPASRDRASIPPSSDGAPIAGADRDPKAVRATRIALERAGVAAAVSLEQADVLAVEPPAPTGILVANPPYGVRIGEAEALAALYPRLGDRLKQRFPGWRCCFFTSDTRLPKLIGLKPARRIPLYNGALECRLYVFDIVAGSMRQRGR